MEYLIRLPELMRATGRGRSAVYSDIAAGMLPPPVKIGSRCAAWPASEIDAVVRAHIAGRTEREICDLVTHLVNARATVDQAAL